MKILSLRGIVSILLIFLTFSSCERYVTECMTPTLGGEYTIDRVEVIPVDQESNPPVVYTYDTCETPLPYPFNKFIVNQMRIEIDYSTIRINKISANSYEINEFYTLKNCTPYSVGFMDFTYKDPSNPSLIRRMIFSVYDDPYNTGVILHHEGVWPHSKWGEKVKVSFYLRRD
jgi:hypothetical protein